MNKEKTGIIFPDSIDDSIQLTATNHTYYRTQGDSETFGWYFKFSLRQQFGYRRYPFDQEDVWLRMRFPDHETNAVLIPDFGSYHLLYESALPGVEQNDFVLNGWKLVGSYYDQRLNHYAGDLGVPGSNMESFVDELYFNVAIKRDFLEPFIAKITPLMMIYITLFITLVLSTGDEKKAASHGFNSFTVLGVIAGLFFSAMYMHAGLRDELASSGISYLECFYILAYFLMVFIIINAGIITWKFEANQSERDKNLISKLLYWPFVTGTVFVISLLMLPV